MAKTAAPPGGEPMTIIEHLRELRTRLIRSILALAGCAVVAWILYPQILDFLKDPYCQTVPAGQSCKLYVTDPLEAFGARLKIAGYGGLVLAMPIILWQIWRFVSPAMMKREKRLAIPFVASAFLLFLLGAAIALYTLPQALSFLQGVGGTEIQEIYSPNRYLGLVSLMMVAFGVSFEFPVLLVFLQIARIIHYKQLARVRRYAIVGIVTFCAVITPSQDPISLLAMSVPLVIFYEIAVLIGWLLRRKDPIES